MGKIEKLYGGEKELKCSLLVVNFLPIWCIIKHFAANRHCGSVKVKVKIVLVLLWIALYDTYDEN